MSDAPAMAYNNQEKTAKVYTSVRTSSQSGRGDIMQPGRLRAGKRLDSQDGRKPAR